MQYLVPGLNSEQREVTSDCSEPGNLSRAAARVSIGFKDVLKAGHAPVAAA